MLCRWVVRVAAPPKCGLLPDRVLPLHPVRHWHSPQPVLCIARFGRVPCCPCWSRPAGGILINHSSDVEGSSNLYPIEVALTLRALLNTGRCAQHRPLTRSHPDE